jgi:SPOR domain
VNKGFITICLFFAGASLIVVGCVPSEETGSGGGARNPVQIFGPIDTTHGTVHGVMGQDTIFNKRTDSVKTAAFNKPRVASKFKSRQDTVQASVVTKSKSSSHSHIKAMRPDRPMFTVQIGAFDKVSHALQSQKKAKEEFPYQPVFSSFIKREKLYRVSIGKFDNRKDASALYDSLKQQHPDEYKLCWINFIP